MIYVLLHLFTLFLYHLEFWLTASEAKASSCENYSTIAATVKCRFGVLVVFDTESENLN